MEKNNIAFIGIRLIGLFLVAANINNIVAPVCWLAASPFIPDDFGIPLAATWISMIAALLPVLAGLVLWFRAKQWSRHLCAHEPCASATSESLDIVRTGCFIMGLYLLLSGLPSVLVQLYQFHSAGLPYTKNEFPSYIEPALRCGFGLATLLGTNLLRQMFDYFRKFGR